MTARAVIKDIFTSLSSQYFGLSCKPRDVLIFGVYFFYSETTQHKNTIGVLIPLGRCIHPLITSLCGNRLVVISRIYFYH